MPTTLMVLGFTLPLLLMDRDTLMARTTFTRVSPDMGTLQQVLHQPAALTGRELAASKACQALMSAHADSFGCCGRMSQGSQQEHELSKGNSRCVWRRCATHFRNSVAVALKAVTGKSRAHVPAPDRLMPIETGAVCGVLGGTETTWVAGGVITAGILPGRRALSVNVPQPGLAQCYSGAQSTACYTLRLHICKTLGQAYCGADL